MLTDRKDPRNGDSSYRLLHIVRAEPAATLFQVPSDYEIKETGIRRREIPGQMYVGSGFSRTVTAAITERTRSARQ